MGVVSQGRGSIWGEGEGIGCGEDSPWPQGGSAEGSENGLEGVYAVGGFVVLSGVVALVGIDVDGLASLLEVRDGVLGYLGMVVGPPYQSF